MYRVSNKSITRSRGAEGSGGHHTNERARTRERRVCHPPIWRLHEGSLGCASISVMTSKRGHTRKKAIASFRGRRVLPSSPGVFLPRPCFPDASRAVSIFVFVTPCGTERAPRIEIFVFVPDHSYCLESKSILRALYP